MNLKFIRESLGMSQKDVAVKMGVSQSNIYNYETNRTQPSLETLWKLADILNCSVDYLLGREDDFGVIHAAPVHNTGLNPIEEELIENFRQLDYYQQKALSIQAKALAEDNANAGVKIIKK